MCRRLTSLLAGLALGLTAACGSYGEATSGATSTTKPAEYKITVAGDSISVGLGASLRKSVGTDAVVKVIGEEGSGLAQPAKFDWPARVQQLAREFPPAVLVFTVGSNDGQDLRDAAGTIVAASTNTAAWDVEYSNRLGRVFDAFQGTATKVVWVGPVRTADDRVGVVNRRIQKLATAVAASRPWVVVADLAELLGTGEQKADRCLMPDGVHLTVACLDEATALLGKRLPKPRG